jgi:hypothetical protein
MTTLEDRAIARQQEALMAALSQSGTSGGPSTDRDNRPVEDPTANVKALTAAAITAESALRVMSTGYQDKIADLRDRHYAEMRNAETARIDAIRLVDTGNVARAAEVSAAQATALAASVIQSAEALRVSNEQSRVQTAAALNTAMTPVLAQLESLRQTQFQQQGEKSAQAEGTGDDRFAKVYAQSQEQFLAVLKQQQNAQAQQQEQFLETLTQSRKTTSNSRTGVIIAGIVGSASVLIALMTLIVLIAAHIL